MRAVYVSKLAKVKFIKAWGKSNLSTRGWIQKRPRECVKAGETLERVEGVEVTPYTPLKRVETGC